MTPVDLPSVIDPTPDVPLPDDDGPVFLDGRDPVPDLAAAEVSEGPVWLASVWDEDMPEVVPTVGNIIGGQPLLYAGESHVVAGPGGSGKSMLAQHLACEVASDGGVVLLLDYESNIRSVALRLKALGLTKEQAGRVAYWRLTGALSGGKLEQLVGFASKWRPTLTVLDSVARAMAALGLSEMANDEYTKFHTSVLERFEASELTFLAIDHTGHAEGENGSRAMRGRGASAKTDAVSGAYYTFHVKEPWTRSQSGSAQLRARKDRGGHRAVGAVVCDVTVRVEDDGGNIRIALSEPAEGADGGRPTILMGRVSKFLEDADGPQYRSTIEKQVSGRAQYVRQAVNQLAKEGYVREVREKARGGSAPVELVKMFDSSSSEDVTVPF